MKIKTIGEVLLAARQHRHLSLQDVATHTNVRLEYLQALEANAFDHLPAAAFVKGFIKSYASVCDIEPEPLLAILRRDYKESADGKLVPRAFLKPLVKKRERWTPVTWVVMVVATIFLTLMSYVGWQWYQIQRPPQLTIDVPVENAVVTPTIEVAGKTVTDGVVSVNAQPVAIQPDGGFRAEIVVPREGIHTITIEVIDRRGKKNIVQRTVHVRKK